VVISSDFDRGPGKSPGKRSHIATVSEITRREQAEELYRTLANSSPMGVYIVRDGQFVFVNAQFLEFTGFTENELLGTDPLNLVHPEDRQMVRENAVAMLKGKRFLSYEFRRITKGKEVKWTLETVTPVRYRGNRATLGNFMDITERKRVEEALRESEERYRTLFDSKVDGVFVIDETMKPLLANKAAADIFGFDSVEEALGIDMLDFIVPEDRERAIGIITEDMFEKDLRQVNEFRCRKKTGEEIWVSAVGSLIEYQGKPAGLASFRDITERRQAEEREKQLQEELMLSSRLASIGELAAGVAHEINNPLTGVIGYSERLLRKSTDEETSRYLGRIHGEARRAAKIVESLLTFARHRAPSKEYADINDILGRALELRAYELRTSTINLEVELAPGLPGTMVDTHQIQQVFLNLILNAEQAMTVANKGGKLTIKTQEMKGHIRISFADNGPGISAKDLDKVFDPFFTTRGEKGGTGLGLSLCHGIITQHRGKIYARSKPGRGSTFFVELPVTTEEG